MVETRLKAIRIASGFQRTPSFRAWERYADPAKLPRFVPRRPELRSLEGRYPIAIGSEIRDLVVSCKWNDILRCANSKHYRYSCFRAEGCHAVQPLKRLFHSDCAVMFIPDGAGTPQWRSWLMFRRVNERGLVELKASYPQGTLDVDVYYGRASLSMMQLVGERLKDVATLEEVSDIYL